MDMTQVKAIEATVRQEAEAWSRHDIEALIRLYATNATLHDPISPEPVKGKEGVRKDSEDAFKSFPDVRITILNILSSGDTAAAEWTLEATNSGPLIFPDGTTLPATNRRLSVRGSSFWHINPQGQIIEERRYYDSGAFFQQLGITPGA
jgi:steroid delta-isomerase-like uncharacterized protein